MKSRLDRRTFLRLASASAALMAQEARPQAAPPSASQPASRAASPATTQAAPAGRRGRVAAVASRKNFVGIQVRAFGWVDEASTRCWTTSRRRAT